MIISLYPAQDFIYSIFFYPYSSQTAEQLMTLAYENGINLFDTAEVYAAGKWVLSLSSSSFTPLLSGTESSHAVIRTEDTLNCIFFIGRQCWYAFISTLVKCVVIYNVHHNEFSLNVIFLQLFYVHYFEERIWGKCNYFQAFKAM